MTVPTPQRRAVLAPRTMDAPVVSPAAVVFTTGPVTVPLGPAVANLTGVRANDRNLIQVTVYSGGVPMDLTGFTVTAQARKAATDADPAVTAEIEILDAVAGKVSLRWPGADVSTALAGALTFTGVWDLQVSDGVVDPITICAGTFAAESDVTRP